MVKQSRNCNAPDGSKAPILEEYDAAALLEDQPIKHDRANHFDPTKKQAIEQRMLEMESLLRAVVHKNTNLRARLEGLEVNN